MKRLGITGCIFFFCFALVYTTGHAASQIISSFNFNDEGWDYAESADISYVATGGNPGGHITFTNTSGGLSSIAAYVPPKFLGNLSQFEGGVIAFDVRSLNPINSIGSGFGRIQMNGTAPNNATYDFAPYPKIPSDTGWTTYYVPFTPEGWEIFGDWQTIIGNVSSIHIVLGGINVAFDNFRICHGLASVFDNNDEQWTAEGAELTYVSDGLKAGGWIALEDNYGDSFIVLPPSKFFGNLTQYRGGMLSYDIKSLDSTPLPSIGSGFGRITIEGGGGYEAMLDYAPNPPIPSNVNWTPYYAPMTADAWNVTEQVWQTILADVTNIYIVLDGAGDVIDLDNFTIMPSKTGPAELWVGLTSGADQGAQFDVRVELYLNTAIISEGEKSCISGITSNPSKVSVTLNSSEADFHSGDTLSMKVFFRTGTNVNGQSCSTMNTTSGLRLYYGGSSYPSRISIPEDLFLDSLGKKYILDDILPTGADQYKDSSKISYNKGNPWKSVGTWKMTLP